MPSYSIGRGILNGATSGGSKLFQAILGADKAYQDGFTREQLSQSRVAQAAGAAAKTNAAAAQDDAETAILNQRPEVFNEVLAARSGSTVPQVRAYRDYLQTGIIPERQLQGPPTEQGVGPGSEPVINPEAMTKLGQLIGQLGLLQGNVKDLNPAQLADADTAYGTQGLRDEVLGGQRTAQSVSDAVAAAAGKYKAEAAAPKAPTGFQWAGDKPGVSLQPIPGGPKDQSVYPPKSPKGGKIQSQVIDLTDANAGRIQTLSQELADIRARKSVSQGDALHREEANEADVIKELKNLGVTKLDSLPKPSFKPLSDKALKMQQDELDAIGLSGGINADLGGLINQIEKGQLELGPVENLISGARNFTGFSNENSRNFQSARATIEKIRNDSLRLNKGVQTEGDAVRALNELVSNLNDKENVLQRLRELQGINQRGSILRRKNIDAIRQNYGAAPLDTSGVFDQSPTVGGGTVYMSPIAPAQIRNDDEYNALPSGAEFISPDGKRRRKP